MTRGARLTSKAKLNRTKEEQYEIWQMPVTAPVLSPSPSIALAELRERVRALERGGGHQPADVTPLGVAALDRRLAGGGLARGRVHEVIGEAWPEVRDAAGFGFTAALVSRLMRDDGDVLWCPRGASIHGGMPCARGLSLLGVDPRRIIMAEARGDVERLWAMEEGLGCAGLVAVVVELGPPKAAARTRESINCRRLQLVAEASGVTGILLRPDAGMDAATTGTPETRWRVTSIPGSRGEGMQEVREAHDWNPRWHVELLRSRNGRPGEARLLWDARGGAFRAIGTLVERPSEAVPQSRSFPMKARSAA
jgi:protein ImuA